VCGNNAGNHFLKVLPVLLSHCSECLKVIQNQTLSKRVPVTCEKVTREQSRQAQWMFQHLYLFLGQKLLLPKVLCKKVKLSRNISLSGQRFCLFDKHDAVNIPKPEDRMLSQLFLSTDL
jgi:hypothetical protein